MRLYDSSKINLISNCCKNIISQYSTSTKNVTEKLVNRSLLKITGKDTIPLLQGLVTSDVNQLSNIGTGCQYTMFLNNKGRVLYDSIIYKMPETDLFLVEVDKSVVITVQKHLNMYRLRRDVKIDNVDDKYSIWAYFNPEIILKGKLIDREISESCKNPNGVDNATTKEVGNGRIIEFADPRVSVLGSRLISTIDSENVISEMYGKPTSSTYKHFRYRLGIGEGVEDFPVGNCFPLEANCDYLHGVSFHKGCYLGQELTARTHHTGVIRKRYMPVFFEAVVETVPNDETVKAGEVNAGKLRGVERDVGLGLLRIEKVLDKDLVVGGMKCCTVKPFWWPCDKVKEDKAVRL